MAQLTPAKKEEENVLEMLQSPKMLAQMKAALPRHVTPERLARIVITQIRFNPALLECSRNSLLGAIMQAAQLGLEPGIQGQCWIIPYGREATFILGYRGMFQLMWRTPLVSAIAARSVFEGDAFTFDFGENTIQHLPGGETDPAKLTHAWAAIHTSNGGRLWDVMTREEIERVRMRSRAKKGGPWFTDYAEMCKKTVLKRLAKIAPASVELQRAIELDEAAERGDAQMFDFDVPQIDEGQVKTGEPPSGIATQTDLIEELGTPIKPSKDSVKATLVASIRAHIERIPEEKKVEGVLTKREQAMANAFGSTNWGELEAYTLKEIEEVVEGGRLTRIVEDALKGAK